MLLSTTTTRRELLNDHLAAVRERCESVALRLDLVNPETEIAVLERVLIARRLLEGAVRILGTELCGPNDCPEHI